MANKTTIQLEEMAQAGDKVAARLGELYATAQRLKPRQDSGVSTLRKAAEMLPDGPGRKAIEKQIAEMQESGDSEETTEQLAAIFTEVASLTCKTVAHGYVKSIGKMIGDFRYSRKDDDDSEEDDDAPVTE
jgi:hypothetical protein